jgi:simple sugar transport system substrate-binding protein
LKLSVDIYKKILLNDSHCNLELSCFRDKTVILLKEVRMKKSIIFVIVLCFLLSGTGLLFAGSEEAEEKPEPELKAVKKDFLDFSDITIRVDCGGPEGGPFASILYNGATAAGELLGCKVEVVWSDWDPGKEVENFKQTIAARPDGAVLIGQPGDEGFGPLVDEAIANGILVTTMTVDLPQTRVKYIDKGFGYAGAELYSAGYALAEKAALDHGLGKGDRAMVWGLLGEPLRGMRTKGCIDALEEKGVTVDYLDISPQTNADPPAGIPVIVAYIASHPDVDLVITDHGGLTATAQTYMEAAGKDPEEILVAGFDLSSATVQAIRSGYVQVVSDQQPWLQAFLAVFQLALAKQFGFSGLYIDTGAGFITKDNIDAVAALAEAGIR